LIEEISKFQKENLILMSAGLPIFFKCFLLITKM